MIPAKFRELYPELAVGRRRKRDVTEETPEQLVSAIWPGGALATTDTCARQRRRFSAQGHRRRNYGQYILDKTSPSVIRIKCKHEAISGQDFSNLNCVYVMCKIRMIIIIILYSISQDDRTLG